MAQKKLRRRYDWLGTLVLAAAVYSGAIWYFHTVTGEHRFDGMLGVALGLYICSQPAENFLNMLFFERHGLSVWRRAEWVWLASNLLAMFVGWVVIVVGTTQLSAEFLPRR